MFCSRPAKASRKEEGLHLFRIFVILFLFFPKASWAETVILKSGKIIEGKIVEKTGQYIKIEVDGMPLYYERKFIADIDENKKDLLLTESGCLKKGLERASEARFEEAGEEFKKGLSLFPDSHNLKQALRLVEGVINGTLKREYALHILKGSYYLMNARTEEALPEFKSALEDNPNADLYYYLGVCYYASGKYAEAIEYLKKAAEEIKGDDQLFYDLGISHYALRRYPEAVAYLEKALEINPQSAEAYGVLGTCHFLLGQPLQAGEELKQSMNLFRGKGDYLKAADVETLLNQIKR